MLSKIRGRATYMNVMVTFGLVFAMSGGAYAAKRYLVNSTKQISPKVLKALQGRVGVAGPRGLGGPAGTPGAAGPQGPQGSQGPQGQKGENGQPGQNGENGKEGSPWTTGGTLPSGKTEEGDWSVVASVSGEAPAATSVSFVIPLKDPPIATYVRVGEAPPEGCTGNVAAPGAEKGHLCVFAATEEDSQNEFFNIKLPTVCPISKQGAVCLSPEAGTVDSFGFGVLAVAKEAGTVNVSGSWVVTAE